VIPRLARELRNDLPEVKGFSERNIKLMVQFAHEYSAPFDKHRELANNYIDQAARLLVVGYGFNDDHLQTHLVKRIRDGLPTIILTRTPSGIAKTLAEESPNCVCLSEPSGESGVSVLAKGVSFERTGDNIWDIGTLAKELLG
jgi:hypothetical protein